MPGRRARPFSPADQDSRILLRRRCVAHCSHGSILEFDQGAVARRATPIQRFLDSRVLDRRRDVVGCSQSEILEFYAGSVLWWAGPKPRV